MHSKLVEVIIDADADQLDIMDDAEVTKDSNNDPLPTSFKLPPKQPKNLEIS